MIAWARILPLVVALLAPVPASAATSDWHPLGPRRQAAYVCYPDVPVLAAQRGYRAYDCAGVYGRGFVLIRRCEHSDDLNVCFFEAYPDTVTTPGEGWRRRRALIWKALSWRNVVRAMPRRIRPDATALLGAPDGPPWPITGGVCPMPRDDARAPIAGWAVNARQGSVAAAERR